MLVKILRKGTIAITAAAIFSSTVYAKSAAGLENAAVEIAATVGKSVVSISGVVSDDIGAKKYFNYPFQDGQSEYFRFFFEEFFGDVPYREYKMIGLGSGTIIDPDGYILTNEHIVAKAGQIKVKLSDGREFDAEMKGVDKRHDLAVIKIAAQGLPAVKLGNSDDIKSGEWVIAIGNPFGFAIDNPEPLVTAGLVSAIHRYLPVLGGRKRVYDDLIQTDAVINPGNSGGPLVNLKSQVIGINNAIIAPAERWQGVGFAIPINKAKNILKRLSNGEKILYGWLGISIQDLNEDLRKYFGIKQKEGVIVLKVYKGSPAEKGGLQEGDLILAFNKQSIKTSQDLIKRVSSLPVGEIVTLEIIRSDKAQSFKIEIGSEPDNEGLPGETLPAAGTLN